MFCWRRKLWNDLDPWQNTLHLSPSTFPYAHCGQRSSRFYPPCDCFWEIFIIFCTHLYMRIFIKKALRACHPPFRSTSSFSSWFPTSRRFHSLILFRSPPPLLVTNNTDSVTHGSIPALIFLFFVNQSLILLMELAFYLKSVCYVLP